MSDYRAVSSRATTTDDKLVERIRSLEEALRVLQSETSTSPHPLLSQELRDIAKKHTKESHASEFHTHNVRSDRTGARSQAIDSESPSTEDGGLEVEDLTENFGMLSMTGYGRSRFFGNTGGQVRRPPTGCTFLNRFKFLIYRTFGV